MFEREELGDVVWRLRHSKGVGFDLDGVLCDFVNPFLKLINESERTAWEYEDVTSYHFDKCLGIKPRTINLNHERFIEKGEYRRLSPYEEGMRIVRELNKRGVWTPVITYRDPRLATDTYEWLYKQGFDLRNGVYFYRDKYELAQQLWLRAFVEDSATNANNIATLAGIKLYLLTRPWNKDKPLARGVERVNDYDMLAKKLLGDGL